MMGLSRRTVEGVVFHRYVALGDSFTEGVGDVDWTRPNGVRGWADRFAEVLQTQYADFGYANLAIRGRKLRQIVGDQLDVALALQPDLVTLYAGANDIMRPKVDIDDLMELYDTAVAKLTASGAHVVLFTAFDPADFPVFGSLRGRFAIYNELVREVADTHGTTLVDYWRLRDYRDERMWAQDRMHMSSAGHQRMAIAVLETLGVPHDLQRQPLIEHPPLSAAERRAANLEWAREYAAPWVKRRLRGTSSGDALDPKYPVYIRL